MAKWMVVCLLGAVALAGCGSGGSGDVSAAVQAVDPALRSFHAHSYAGLEVEGARLVIYRKPGAPALETAARERVGDVEIEFRDAPYALDVLQPLADRVSGDRHRWKTRDLPVTLAMPRTDGTGVNVFVTAPDIAAAQAEFGEFYGAEPIIVQPAGREGIVPVG